MLSKEVEVGAAEHLTFAGFDAQISVQTEHVLIARGGLPESPGTTSAFSWIIPSSGSGDGGASLVAHGDGLVRHGALPAVTVMVPRPGALPRATTARVA